MTFGAIAIVCRLVEALRQSELWKNLPRLQTQPSELLKLLEGLSLLRAGVWKCDFPCGMKIESSLQIRGLSQSGMSTTSQQADREFVSDASSECSRQQW